MARLCGAFGERWQGAGHTVIVVAADQRAVGAIALGDELRPDAAQAVAAMRAAGMEPVLVTGDNARAAGHIATQLGIDDVQAGVRPEGKAVIVRELQADHPSTPLNIICRSLLAFTFNGIGIPLATTGLVSPVWAMVAMAASVTSIFGNSLGAQPSLLFQAINSVGRRDRGDTAAVDNEPHRRAAS